MKPVYEDLFRRIDLLELTIQFYELAHGRRKEPPRAQLQQKFDLFEIAAAQETASKWN
jgi:hypothetical protein